MTQPSDVPAAPPVAVRSWQSNVDFVTFSEIVAWIAREPALSGLLDDLDVVFWSTPTGTVDHLSPDCRAGTPTVVSAMRSAMTDVCKTCLQSRWAVSAAAPGTAELISALAALHSQVGTLDATALGLDADISDPWQALYALRETLPTLRYRLSEAGGFVYAWPAAGSLPEETYELLVSVEADHLDRSRKAVEATEASGALRSLSTCAARTIALCGPRPGSAIPSPTDRSQGQTTREAAGVALYQQVEEFCGDAAVSLSNLFGRILADRDLDDWGIAPAKNGHGCPDKLRFSGDMFDHPVDWLAAERDAERAAIITAAQERVTERLHTSDLGRWVFVRPGAPRWHDALLAPWYPERAHEPSWFCVPELVADAVSPGPDRASIMFSDDIPDLVLTELVALVSQLYAAAKTHHGGMVSLDALNTALETAIVTVDIDSAFIAHRR